MAALDNLLIIGVRDNPDIDFTDAEEGIAMYYLNVWRSEGPSKPTVIPVPYRGGYLGGFSDMLAVGTTLFVADGEGIVCSDMSKQFTSPLELDEVREVSDLVCRTMDHLVSCLFNRVQIRSLQAILNGIQRANDSVGMIKVPYRELHYEEDRQNVLSMNPIEIKGINK